MAQDIAAVSKPAGSGKFIGITIVIFVIIIFFDKIFVKTKRNAYLCSVFTPILEQI
jgi:hypothetical protein